MTTQDFTEIASFESQMMSEAMRLCTEARLDFHLQFDDSTESFTIQAGDMLISPMYRQCVDEGDDATLEPLCPSQLMWALVQYNFPDDAPEGAVHEDEFKQGDVLGEAYTVLHSAPAECLSEILSVLCNVITARIEKAHNHAD